MLSEDVSIVGVAVADVLKQQGPRSNRSQAMQHTSAGQAQNAVKCMAGIWRRIKPPPSDVAQWKIVFLFNEWKQILSNLPRIPSNSLRSNPVIHKVKVKSGLPS